MSRPVGPLIGELIPTSEGRQLLVRPAWRGEGVQIATIGKRGGLVEASCLGLEQVIPFIAAVDGVSELAWAVHERQLKRSRRERERRHAAALASNPWLQKRNRSMEVV